MSNLVITIIALALTAVAALMGIYYGGQAYQGGNARAQVSTVLSALEQVAGAWRVFASTNGGAFNAVSAGGSSTRISSNLVPTYLTSVPFVPENILDTSQHTSLNDRIFLRTMFNFWQGHQDSIDMAMIYTTKEFCVTFASYVGKDNNPPERTTDRNLVPIGIRPADCYWYDVNGNNVMDDLPTDRYVIAYEVW